MSNVENNLSDEKLFYHVYESKIKNNNETIKILLLGSSVAINFSDNTNNAYDLNRKIPHKTNKNYNILVKKMKSIFLKKILFFITPPQDLQNNLNNFLNFIIFI